MECCINDSKKKYSLGILECYLLEDLAKVGKLNWKPAGFFGAYNITKCLQDELFLSYMDIFLREEDQRDKHSLDYVQDVDAFYQDFNNPQARQYVDAAEAALFA